MTSSFRLGRIFGIEVGVNWSWLVVFALIVWTLATGVFPSQNPGLSDGTYVAMGIVAALLFFASILLHELGHALQARRDGMEIDGITLWLFGGVARFRGMFPSAGAEFRIAIAGPLVTLVIGVLFVVVAVVTSGSDEVDGVAAWLGYINLFLLAFNLIPALPLDGGRVLRAALWKAKRDFAWATERAADVGRGFAFLMIAGGVLLAIFQSGFSGIWLAFLGWFLLTAASAEARSVAARQALSGLRVRDLMVTDPVVAYADEPVGRFVDESAGFARHTAYPVLDEGRVVGLVPFQRVMQTPRTEWDNVRVRDVMVPIALVPVVAPERDVSDVLPELVESEVSRALVLDGDRFAGFLSLSDIARRLGRG